MMRAKILPTLMMMALGTGILSGNRGFAADGATKSLPVVYDPLTKKYFIGANAKLTLRQGQDSSSIERVEVSVDNGEYKTYGESLDIKEEGKHTVKFRAVNLVNGWSPLQYFELFVDLTAPTTDAKFTDDKYFTSGEGTFVGLKSSLSLVSQDNLAGVASIEYSLDGNTFIPYSKPIVFDKAGKQTVFYRSTDRVGNAEQAKKLDVIVDGAAPTTDLKLAGPKPAIINGKNYVSDSVAFTVNSSDDLSKIRQTWVVIDGKAQPYIKPIYFLQEGSHTLSYYSVDNVGNKEESKTFSLYTVSVPPRTAAVPNGKLVNTGGINYARPDFQLSLSAQDNVVGLDRVEYKLGTDAEFKTYIEPIRFSTPGVYTLSYRSVDRAGNFEPTRSFTVHVTDVAPETSIATAQPLVSRDNQTYSPAPNVITLNVGSSPVGVKQTLVSINDGAFTPYTGPLTLSSDQRVYKIAYKSVDKLDNEETAKTMTLHMIGSVPVVDLFISNGQKGEENVRTNYLEGATQSAHKAQPAAAPAVTAAKPAVAKPVAKKRSVASPAQPVPAAPAAAPASAPAAGGTFPAVEQH